VEEQHKTVFLLIHWVRVVVVVLPLVALVVGFRAELTQLILLAVLAVVHLAAQA
jgi:hypothetical protein